jgi:hypothetical protein
VRGGQVIIESAIAEADSLRKVLKRRSSERVNSADEKQIARATALAWFNNNRADLAELLGADQIKPIDDHYRELLKAVGHSTLRTKYLSLIKDVNKKLGALRAEHAIVLANAPSPAPQSTTDTAPSFSPLISDPKMQAILTRRWQECSVCVNSGAPLAATVMMGGLLEGLLLAKINQLTDKSIVFSSAAAPVDKRTGKSLPLKEWGLKNFIDAAFELLWITKTTKDVGEVLRDYRNYIHPQKEFSHGIVLAAGDAQMLWEVSKGMARQLLNP